jgi:hypothetical protein
MKVSKRRTDGWHDRLATWLKALRNMFIYFFSCFSFVPRIVLFSHFQLFLKTSFCQQQYASLTRAEEEEER